MNNGVCTTNGHSITEVLLNFLYVCYFLLHLCASHRNPKGTKTVYKSLMAGRAI